MKPNLGHASLQNSWHERQVTSNKDPSCLRVLGTKPYTESLWKPRRRWFLLRRQYRRARLAAHRAFAANLRDVRDLAGRHKSRVGRGWDLERGQNCLDNKVTWTLKICEIMAQNLYTEPKRPVSSILHTFGVQVELEQGRQIQTAIASAAGVAGVGTALQHNHVSHNRALSTLHRCAAHA